MSTLDARIRKLAREEAEAVAAAVPAVVLETSGPDRLAVLEEELADLRNAFQRLDARLDAIEKAARVTDQEEKPAPRRVRKTTGAGE